MDIVVLSIGSNLGNRIKTLKSAVADISSLPGVRLGKLSSVYQTPPWGPVKQPNFLNAVLTVSIQPDLKPIDFLRLLQKIEEKHGRTREIPWGPRTLDIDIIVIGDLITNSSELVVPHPYAQEREFVLIPWLEIDRQAKIPGVGKVNLLLKKLDPSIVTIMPKLSLI